MCKKVYVISSMIVFLFGVVKSATIGSDTAVQRFNTQQILQTGDRVAGFAALQGGLRLLTINTTSTFDCFFGVSGSAAFNGGTLILNRDLIFQESAVFYTISNIAGNGHTMRISPDMKNIPFNPNGPTDCSIQLVTTTPQTVAVDSVSWSFDNKYLAVGTLNNPTANELFIYNFNGSTLTTVTSVSQGGDITSLAWHPFKYCLAVGQDNNATTPEIEVFTFSTTAGSLSLTFSVVPSSAGIDSLAWHPTGNYLTAGVTTINIYPVNTDCTLNVTGALVLTFPDVIALNTFDWDVTGSFLVVGASTAAYIYKFTSSPSLSLVQQTTVSGSTRGVSWNHLYPTYLALGFQTVTPFLQLYNYSISGATLTQFASASPPKGVHAVDWNPGGICLAYGTYNSTGNPTLYTLEFNATNSSLTQVSSFVLSDTVNCLNWSPNGNYLAVGGNSGLVSVYESSLLNLQNCYTWSNLNVQLEGDTTFNNGCVTLSGISSINGNGCALSIGSTFTLFIDKGAQVTIFDIVLSGLSGTQLSCLDNTSTVTFINATLILDGNYTFSVGSLNVMGEVLITGSAGTIFAYQSTQPATIQIESTLTIDDGMTFSYAPLSAANNLIKFTDNTSQLFLNGATLFATVTGLQLTKGTLIIDRSSSFVSDAINASESISLGDGASGSNNMNVEFRPAAVLKCTGFVRDNNV